MKFKKYSEIENTYREDEIQRIRSNGFDDSSIKWSVTEKVDGSNLSFWISPDLIKVAKRSQFLSPNEIFYNHNVILEKYQTDFYNIYQIIRSHYGQYFPYIVIYGEIFGGSYNHPGVIKSKNAKKVQNRIQYCPWNDYYVFDIAYPNPNNDEIIFLNATEFEFACANSNLLYAEPLFTGTFDECLSFNNEFVTTIPKKLNLPEIEGNYAEGVVIKPDIPLFFRNGNRVILKNKNDKFSEKIKTPQKKKPLLPEVSTYIEYIKDYITESRYVSVVSKIGEVSFDNFGEIIKNYSEDVLTEFSKDYPDFETLDKDIKKQITKEMNKIISPLIRRQLMKWN